MADEELTQTELDRLSPEELAGLKDEDDGEELINATGTKEVDDDDIDDDGVISEDISDQEAAAAEAAAAGEAGKDGEPAADPEKPAEEKPGEAAEESAAGEAAQETQSQQPAAGSDDRPFPDLEDDTEDFSPPPAIEFREYVPKIDVKAAEAELVELQKQYDEGDIDERQLHDKRVPIERSLNAEYANYSSIVDHNKWVSETLERGWRTAQMKFFNQPENRSWLKNDIKFAAMSAAQKELLPKFRGKSHAELLRASKALAEKELGIAPAPPKPKDEKKIPPAPPKPQMHKTITDLPGASPDVGSGKYAALDAAMKRGDAEEINRLASKLSPKEMDEWTSR